MLSSMKRAARLREPYSSRKIAAATPIGSASRPVSAITQMLPISA
jgi:hypothetical protein